VPRQRSAATRNAFLQGIRAEPDEDAHRLVYADWLDDQGDAGRAEFIRVQCELARPPQDARRHAELAAREKELLEAHRLAWTDLAFADWLGHRKAACRNPKGHDFCKLVARGIRTRCARDALPPGAAARERLAKRLKALGERMEEFDYFPGTCEAGLFSAAEFRRGFVERADMEAYAVNLFAEALPELSVLRELDLDDDSLSLDADESLRRLLSVLDRLPLKALDVHMPVTDPDTLRLLAQSPRLAGFATLSLWCEFGATGDEAARILASSPHCAGLRSLTLEHTRTFTNDAVLAILDSPHLAGLTACRLRPNDEPMRIRSALVKRFRARFGTAPEGPK
jgi:uncharacterized protein (TIGR02996 family)